jgi:hypothetical protein
MGVKLTPGFLLALADMYDGLRPRALSDAFLADLREVHGSLPIASDANLLIFANRLEKWRSKTRELVRTRLAELSDDDPDDPLLCPISLFRTMDYGRLETAHTRVLAWLLDPNGEHGFKETIITALLRHLAPSRSFEELRVGSVKSEYPIKGLGGKGRLDILAEGTSGEGGRGGWVLVVEAKVDSGEGESQLDKYEKWLQSHAKGRDLFCVFLTPHGRESETGGDEWEPLSFLELVRVFRSVYRKLSRAQGFHFLRFYLAGVLQDVCNFPRNVSADAADPYAIASYLNAVHNSETKGARP